MAPLIGKAAVCAAAVAGAAASSSSFLHAGRAQGDACACLKWKEVYATGGVKCGMTNEYRIATHKSSLAGVELFVAGLALGGEFCSRFYQTLDDNVCVNLNMGRDEGQWCYVSQECTDLRGGAPVPHMEVAWKACGEQDRRLRDKTPEQLASFAAAGNFDLGLLHKMSYPLYQARLWGDLEGLWSQEKSAQDLPADIRQELEEIKSSGKPYSFDTAKDNHPPHRIVVGGKVYAVSSGPNPSINPGSWQQLSCVIGCDK
mmetsp:Transcript_112686/g.349759  ORF Transcript_112686/g.349759 Transcript_112686/m.349759 type:complete len:258 (+) Transcript_112686:60-833(+)